MQQLAYLDVHNHSLHTQGFVVYPSTPTITSPSADKVDMQIRVFQASKLLQGDGHGTIRFMLPCAPPLNWGKPEEQPAIIVMAGSRSANQDQNFGPTGGVRPIPSGSYWKLVTTGPNNGNMAKNVCVLTAPAGSEPFILTDEAMKTGGYAFAQDLDKGMFRILTDELLGTNKSVIAFAGIGAVNPNFPNHVVPIVTWDVAPSSVYTVKADMSSWQVVALSNSAPATALDFSTLPSSIPVAFAPAPESNATDVYFTANNSFSNEP
ncbi:hypothetical protein FPSE_07798 [Fusarium pseudograminearum CS3096]|uniref:Uncharacterized protein n=1 Tax=Fusarium pseudograminearum (strain CS3096) TaxID=1028729 RepID=K3UJB9_FUSPC|nr:hypothetical protein FPSE_07798 [Fusarium pseudograminearum CS3096]EKJ72056.1 hypothetical protein FPSE_07798 [Fusarium pseudograminearum CS3096]KAF0645910.1 hypothetical protein FPSE5266_07798 [Fusarium pseudograminearum]